MSVWKSLIRISSDIILCVFFVLLADGVLLALSPDSIAIRSLVGFPLLLFVPGYTIVAALFLYEGRPSTETASVGQSTTPLSTSRIDLPARLALSFGVSVTLLPIVALCLEMFSVGVTLSSLSGSLTVIVITSGIAAIVRRQQVPPAERYTPQLGRKSTWSTWLLGDGDSPATHLLNVGLVVALIVAITTLGYGLTVPDERSSYTEVALLSQNETGSLTMANYPRNFTQGETQELVLQVSNREGKPITYTTVVQLQRVSDDGNRTTVRDRETVARFTERVGANDTWRKRHSIAPEMTGTDLRLVYLLYRSDPPPRPDRASAYRNVYLWVNVTNGSSSSIAPE